MYPHGKSNVSLNTPLNKDLIEHVSLVDKHFSVYRDLYRTLYGDVLDASCTENPDDMLAYLAENAGVKDGMKLIDAGCGVCGPARYLASRFDVHIDAITAAKVHYNVSVEKNKEVGLDSRIKVVYGDYHILAKMYPSNSYDLIYFFEAFCHAFDCHTVIREVHKVLKLGGHIYMKDWFLSDRLRKRDPSKYENVRRRINEVYSFNFKDGINEVQSVKNFMNNNGFKVEFARTPAYDKGDYHITAIFNGDHDLGGDIHDVFDVIEISELKATKL